jgi:hypothetical protein
MTKQTPTTRDWLEKANEATNPKSKFAATPKQSN